MISDAKDDNILIKYGTDYPSKGCCIGDKDTKKNWNNHQKDKLFLQNLTNWGKTGTGTITLTGTGTITLTGTGTITITGTGTGTITITLTLTREKREEFFNKGTREDGTEGTEGKREKKGWENEKKLHTQRFFGQKNFVVTKFFLTFAMKRQVKKTSIIKF